MPWIPAACSIVFKVPRTVAIPTAVVWGTTNLNLQSHFLFSPQTLETMRRILSRTVTAAALRAPRPAPSFIMPSASQTSKVATRRLHATAQHLKPAAAALAFNADNYPTTHEKIQNVQDTPFFIDNKFVKSEATQFIDLHDPATNNLVTRVPQNTDAELKAAVESAQKAFPAWRNTSVMTRQQIMFKFTQLIRENWDRLAASITLEQGKTFAGM